MRTVSKIFMTLALVGVVALVTSAPSAAECTNTTTLVAGGSVRDICSDAAFTSGADSTVDGNISAKAGVTLGATSKVNGSVTAGAAFTSGDGSVVSGDVTSEGDITLGANSIITGSVHSKTGVINYGADAKVGKVIK